MPSLNTTPYPTLSFSLGVEGWPSFYSYRPDFMMGMNNYFYSWSGGNLYQHNSNAVPRNNFYGQQYNTEVITVFNEAPISNLLWKTIHLEGTHPWSAELETDLQTGLVDVNWFTKKEGAWFAFLRNYEATIADYATNEGWLDSRSIAGVGTGTVGASTDFIVFNYIISDQISVGDYIFTLDGSGVPNAESQILNIQPNVPFDGNTSVTVTGSIFPAGNQYFASYKNFQAESTGMVGHYNYIKLTNTLTTVTELFAVEAEVMASFPYP